jgi:hypothetical protein
MNQDRGVGWRDDFNIAQNAANGAALADDILEAKLGTDVGLGHIIFFSVSPTITTRRWVCLLQTR